VGKKCIDAEVSTMTEQILNNWQRGVENDVAATQQIIAKVAKLKARHTHLCTLVMKQTSLAAVSVLLAEADRCVKDILFLLEELELLFEKELFQ
jgi:hypothetical protein